MKSLSPRFAAMAAGAFLASFLLPAQAAAPAIVVTNLPAYGPQGNLSGYVTNADVSTNSVMVFINTATKWYSVPSCAGQSTPIQSDGAWTANITPTAADESATEIAVFLVPANYDPPCVSGAAQLTIPAQAEAEYYTTRVPTNDIRFNWSGYGWFVRPSCGCPEGPGPNYYSTNSNNVWVDAQGCLHLAITYTNNQWQCVNIVSDRTFGYGQYRFTVLGDLDDRDPVAVLGMFTYAQNDSAYNYREIDIEQSRWDGAYGTNVVEDYAVSPYDAGQLLYMDMPASVANSTHSFIWQSNSIVFQSLNGGFASPPAATNILQSYTVATGVPPAGGEQVQINLWLDKGRPPAYGLPIEVVLGKFEFVPLGLPQPAQLGPLATGLSGGEVRLSVQGAADWHYDILSSSNLLNWATIASNIIATNNSFYFTDTNPLTLFSRFYDAVTEP